MTTDDPEQPTTAGSAVPATVDVVDDRVGFVPYARALHRSRLRAVLMCSLPVYLLGLVALVPIQLAGGTAVVNGELTVLSVRPAIVAVAATLLALAVVAALVGHGAAALLGIAAAVRLRDPGPDTDADADVRGEPRAPATSLRWAVTSALRRLPTLVVLWLLGTLLFLAVTTGGLALILVDFPTWLAVVAAVLAGWLAFSPFALAWPVALAERRGPWGALRRSWQLTRNRVFRTGLYVLLFGYGIPGAVTYAVNRVPDMFAGWTGPWPLALVAAVLSWAVAVVAVAVLASVQVSVLFHHTTVDDLEAVDRTYNPAPERATVHRDRLLDVLEGPERTPAREWRWVAMSRRDAAMRAVAGLVVPSLLATGLLWWNPAGAPSYTKATLTEDSSNLPVQPVAMPDGSVATVALLSRSVVVGRCFGARCVASVLDDDEEDEDTQATDTMSLAGPAVTAGPGGRLVFSGWRGLVDESGGGGWDDLRLVECAPKQCNEALLSAGPPRAPAIDHERSDPDSLELRTAVASDGKGGYLVASLVAQERALTLYHCADVRCADPTTTTLDHPDLDILPSKSDLLSVSASDGRVAVLLTDTATGEVTLFTCASIACARIETTRIAAASRLDSELESQYRMGAQVVLPPDGPPVIAHREIRTGAVRVVSCADLACTKRAEHAVTGQGWGHPWPALAVDGTGRPLVATYDLGRQRLVLVSCDDTRCADTTTVPIASWEHGPGYAGLTVDRRGRPVITWSDTDPYGGLFDDGPVYVARCDEPRCGAP